LIRVIAGYLRVVAGTAFVLGGGGLLGSAEAGMARALLEADIVPDLICGTSIGAINGAALAADPTPDGVLALLRTWERLAEDNVLGGSLVGRVVELVRSGTALHGNAELRRLLRDRLPASTFDQLTVPFECVAASIERAQEHWFDDGDLVEAVLASCALPGVFPPVRIDDEHFVDGGLVNSIPLDRAVRRGADTVWVLHVGRVEQELRVPRRPWEVGFVAFEIARRHRFHTDLGRIPDGVRVHVLPTGRPPGQATTWENLRYRDRHRTDGRAEQAYRATRAYLTALA
jgi:NTE family protein